jgi:hypothetical protein
MRLQANPTAVPTLPAATKPARSPHAPAMKATPAAAAATSDAPAKPVATPAMAAEAAASPETYGGAGSLLDAHA